MHTGTDALPRPRRGNGPPALPRTLVGVGGQDGIALSWEQDGPVDHWTVYVDPMDGSDTAVYTTTRPRFEVTDLAPGDHEVGVVAWRDGQPSPGAGMFLVVSVLGPPDDGPPAPQTAEVTVTADTVTVTWDARPGDLCEARLIASDWTVQARVDRLATRSTWFTGLAPDTEYGVQLRVHDQAGSVSTWSPVRWLRTSRSLVRQKEHGPASPMKVR